MSHDAQRPDPAQILMQMVMGKFISRSLTTAANLGLADELGEAPRPAAELAAAVGANADAVGRLLRALAAVGVFRDAGEGRFANNEVSDLLRADAPASMMAMVRWINAECSWNAWGALDHSVRTGQPAFDHVHGAQVFDYFARHPDQGAIFNEAMVGFSTMIGGAVAESYEFGALEHLVDVGGGHGGLSLAIARRWPELRLTVYDRPEVVAEAVGVARARAAGTSIETAAGDFFEGVPAGADAYVLKHILHDWSDDHCARILSRCREAMAPGGRVLVVEALIDDSPEATFPKLLDLEMLVFTQGGRERTEAEFAALFARAGLRLQSITPTPSPVVILEAVAA